MHDFRMLEGWMIDRIEVIEPWQVILKRGVCDYSNTFALVCYAYSGNNEIGEFLLKIQAAFPRQKPGIN